MFFYCTAKWISYTYIPTFLDFFFFSFRSSLVAQQWRICLSCRRCRFDPWVRKIPWRSKWQPTLVFLLQKSHEEEPGGLQSRRVTKEQDVTYWLQTVEQWTNRRKFPFSLGTYLLAGSEAENKKEKSGKDIWERECWALHGGAGWGGGRKGED